MDGGVSVEPKRPLLTWLNVSLNQLCLLPGCTVGEALRDLTLWGPRCPPTRTIVCHLPCLEADSLPGGTGKGSQAQPSLLCLGCQLPQAQ